MSLASDLTGGIPPSNRTQSVVPVAVPSASGYPVFDTSKGDGGWHSGPPNLGVSELTGDGACDDPFVPDDAGTCRLVEHAASTRIIKKQEISLSQTVSFTLDIMKRLSLRFTSDWQYSLCESMNSLLQCRFDTSISSLPEVNLKKNALSLHR